MNEHLLRYALRLGDTSLILAQRLGEWVGHAPAIEEDLGLANIALDLLGQARYLLAYAAEIEGRGRTEDDLAFARTEDEYFNLQIVEQPNGDFAFTIVRQFLVDALQVPLYERLAASADPRLAEIAAKALKESRYHLRYSSGWLERLGDGTAESHERTQRALDALWPYTHEFFAADETDTALAGAGIAPDLREVERAFRTCLDTALRVATLTEPPPPGFRWHGKRGQHSEHLGRLLTDLQYMHRAYPDARW